MDADLRKLERAVSAGDVDATRELARHYARRGDEERAYLLLWKARAEPAELEALGARIATRQRDALQALHQRPYGFRVAVDGKWTGHRLWSVDWADESAERALMSGRPALALRVDYQEHPYRLQAALEALRTVVAVEFVGAAEIPDLAETLQHADVLGCLRMGKTVVPPKDLKALNALPSLVYVSFEKAKKITDAHLKALAKFPHLASVELRECTGFSAQGIKALAKAPRMTWIDLPFCNTTLRGLKGAAKASARTDTGPGFGARTETGPGFGTPGSILREHLGSSVGAEVHRIFATLRDAEDPIARELVRRTSRALLLADSPLEARAAVVPLLELGLRRDPSLESPKAVSQLARDGVRAYELLRPTAELLRSSSGRIPYAAELALRRCALHGWDLTPIADLLPEALAGMPKGTQAASAAVREALLRRHASPYDNRPDRTTLDRTLDRGLASPHLHQAATAAALGLESRSPAVLFFMALAGVHGDRPALEAIPTLLRSQREPNPLPLGPETLELLAPHLAPNDPLATPAAAVLWAAARRGHDMTPALSHLNAHTQGDLHWTARGASPDLRAYLSKINAAEILPENVFATRQHGSSDDETSSHYSGRACGSCSGKNTTCVFHEGYGSNAGGYDEWELLCHDCGLYTYDDHDWG